VNYSKKTQNQFFRTSSLGAVTNAAVTINPSGNQYGLIWLAEACALRLSNMLCPENVVNILQDCCEGSIRVEIVRHISGPACSGALALRL